MGLKMPIQKKADTEICGHGDSCPLTPFALWESPARVQEDNTACGFGFRGLSAYKNLKGCGVPLGQVCRPCPERKLNVTKAARPLTSGYQTLPFSLLQTPEAFCHQVLCWDRR